MIPESRRSFGEGNGNPLQYSCLENPIDRGAWQTIVHGVAKSWARLSNWTELNWATNTTALSVTWFANISSRSIGCLFTLLIVSFAVKKLFNVIWLVFSLVLVFTFTACAFGQAINPDTHYVKELLPYVFPRIFEVSGLTFKSLTYFELTFMFSKIKFQSVLFHLDIQFPKLHLFEKTIFSSCCILGSFIKD